MSFIDDLNLEEKLNIENLDEKLDIIRQYQQYFFLGITLIIATQLIFSLIIPNISTFSESKTSLEKYSRSLNLRKKQAATKENIKIEEDRLNMLLSNKKNLFFSKKEVEKYSISELPKIAEKFKITVTDVNFSKSKKLSYDLSSHPISFKGTTTFFNLMKFIYEIEESQKTISIKSFKLSRKSLNPVTLSVDMTLEILSLKGLE